MPKRFIHSFIHPSSSNTNWGHSEQRRQPGWRLLWRRQPTLRRPGESDIFPDSYHSAPAKPFPHCEHFSPLNRLKPIIIAKKKKHSDEWPPSTNIPRVIKSYFCKEQHSVWSLTDSPPSFVLLMLLLHPSNPPNLIHHPLHCVILFITYCFLLR